LIDVIEDIEEDPEAALILSSFEGPSMLYLLCKPFPLTLLFADACRTYELTWAIREASELSRRKKLEASQAAAAEQKAAAAEQKAEATAA
jgi:hypothetical protein